MMTSLRFLKLAFLAALCCLCTLTTMVSAAEDEDKEPTQCATDTEALQETPEYEQGRMAIVTSLAAIESDESNCADRDDFYWCAGSLSQAALANHTSTCQAAGGTVHEIKNVRITCKISSPHTFTNIEMIPECLAAACTDEEEIDGFLEDYVGGLDDLAEEAEEGGGGRCIVNEGDEFPHAGGPSGAAVLAFVARKALVAAVVATSLSSVLFGV